MESVLQIVGRKMKKRRWKKETMRQLKTAKPREKKCKEQFDRVGKVGYTHTHSQSAGCIMDTAFFN